MIHPFRAVPAGRCGTGCGGSGTPASSSSAHPSSAAPASWGRALEERGFDSLFLAEHSHNGRDGVPFTVFGAPGPEPVEGFAGAGVERVTFMLPTVPEAESLAALDRLAEAVRSYR